VSDFGLTPNEQFFSYIMTRASHIDNGKKKEILKIYKDVFHFCSIKRVW